MMKYIATSIDNENIDLGNPIFVRINKSLDAPADSLYAVFCFKNSIDQLKFIKVYCNAKLIFSGILDEQVVEISQNGSLFKVQARSIAALLLDNEALPQTYINSSLKTIFDKHIKPYGFSEITGDNRKISDKFVVYKGMSEWEVLESFCKLFLGTRPIVSNEYSINATGSASGSKVIELSNYLNKFKYKSIKQNILRYNRISEVFIKADESLSYALRLADDDAIASGIRRKRYINAVGDIRTPVRCGSDAISDANKKSFVVTASCIGMVDANVLDKVIIYDKFLGKLDKIFVSKFKYTMDSNGEVTEITMYKEN